MTSHLSDSKQNKGGPEEKETLLGPYLGPQDLTSSPKEGDWVLRRVSVRDSNCIV